MSYRQVAALAFRMLGLYLFVTQLSWMLMSFPFFLGDSEAYPPYMRIIQVTTYVFSFMTAALVWRFADSLAGRATANIEPAEASDSIGAEDLKSVATVTIGVFLIASALPPIFSISARYVSQYIGGNGVRSLELFQGQVGELYSNIFRLIVGLWLFLGSRGLLGAAKTLRSAGYREDSADQENV